MYYRYDAAFLATSGLIRLSTLEAGIAKQQGADRNVWVEVTRQQPDRVAEPTLLGLLKDGSATVRLRAAVGLAHLGSPAGDSVLREMRPAALASERQAVDYALTRIASLTFPQQYGSVIRTNEDGTTVVFDTGGAAVYLGQVLHVKRDKHLVASLRVTHRRPEHHIAAGKIIETFSETRRPGVDDVVCPQEKGDKP